MLKHTINKLVNIHSHEWPRVGASWTLFIFTRISYVIAWTLIMAIFISRLGVESLPLLFILNAVFIIFGTFIYSELLKKFSQQKITIYTALAGSCLFFINYYIGSDSRYEILFLSLMTLSISVFLSQLFILVNLFIEELFTPLESARTFPIIESSEVFGGIVGGFIISIFSSKIDLNHFILIVAVLLIFTAILAHHFHCYSKKFPFLDFHHSKIKAKDEKFRIKESFEKIKKLPFAKFLAISVVLQFVIFTFTEFQFAKSISYEIEKHEEIAQSQDFKMIPEHLAVSLVDIDKVKQDNHVEASHSGESLENEIAHKLGLIVMYASIATLFFQIFFSSKIIAKLGIVKSMLVHPIIVILNSILLSWKFGSLTGSNLKISFEITNSLFTNSYHCSYYGLQEKDRAMMKEFMDGLMKPLGIIIATAILFITYKFIPPSLAIISINAALIIFSLIFISVILKLKKKYTELTLENIKNENCDLTSKSNAIEILSQKGHGESLMEFVRDLDKKSIHISIKSKLIEVMAHMPTEKTLHMLLEYLFDESEQIKAKALIAIRTFLDKEKFHLKDKILKSSLITKLKIHFELNDSEDVKYELMKTIGQIDRLYIETFIINTFKNSKDISSVNSAIKSAKLFTNDKIAGMLMIYMKNTDIRTKTNAICSLWTINTLKPQLLLELDNMFCELDKKSLISAFKIASEIKDMDRKPLIKNFLKSNDLEIRLFSSIALAQLEDEDGINHIVKLLMHENNEIAAKTKEKIKNLSAKVKNMIDKRLYSELYEKLNKLVANHKHKDASLLPEYILNKLKQYYEIAENHEEAMRIEEILEERGA